MQKYSIITLAALLILTVGCRKKDSGQKEYAAFQAAQSGDWQLCQQLLGKNIPENPSSSCLLLHALCRERNGQLDQAMDLAHQATVQSPKDYAAWYTFGRLLALDKRRQTPAFEALERAADCNLNHEETLILLANIGTSLHIPRTRVYIERLRRMPKYADNPILYYQSGYCAAFSSQEVSKDAVLSFKKSLPHLKKNPEIALYIARIFDYRWGKYNAVSYYELFLKHSPDSSPELKAEASQRIAAYKRRR